MKYNVEYTLKSNSTKKRLMSQITLDFFTPVVAPKNSGDKSCAASFIEFVDAFFHLSGPRAEISGAHPNGTDFNVKILPKNEPTSCLTTALKIAGYFTLILPLILLIAKVISRSIYTYYVEVPPPPIVDREAELCKKYGLGNPERRRLQDCSSSVKRFGITTREAIQIVSGAIRTAKDAGLSNHVFHTNIPRPEHGESLDSPRHAPYKICVMHEVRSTIPERFKDDETSNLLEAILEILREEREIDAITKTQENGYDVYTVDF